MLEVFCTFLKPKKPLLLPIKCRLKFNQHPTKIGFLLYITIYFFQSPWFSTYDRNNFSLTQFPHSSQLTHYKLDCKVDCHVATHHDTEGQRSLLPEKRMLSLLVSVWSDIFLGFPFNRLASKPDTRLLLDVHTYIHIGSSMYSFIYDSSLFVLMKLYVTGR